MTIVRLKGGLGNQMFQYATGLSVSKRNGQDLLLDLSAYDAQPDKDTFREFELDAFNISQNKRTKTVPSPLTILVRKLWNKLFPQDTYGFSSSVFSRDWLDGFYQNERYFIGIRKQILNEFTLHDESARFKETRTFIKSRPSVSLHVRRGDYVSNRHAHAHHGVTELEYFRRAYDHLVSRIGTDFTLFIFTDDTEWAESSINFHPRTFILSGQGFSAPEELVLMSSCDHHVISNSTFSWWGAWLNPASEKIVVAPRQWTVKRSSDGIIPPTWTRI